jgi:hypothetical protein
MIPKLLSRKDDRQALSATLCVPNESSPPLLLTIKVQGPDYNFVRSSKLLISVAGGRFRRASPFAMTCNQSAAWAKGNLGLRLATSTTS